MNTGFQFALGQNQGAWYGTGDPMDAVNTQASGVGMCNPGVITNSSGMIYNNFNFQNGLQTMGIDNVTSTFMLGSDISAPATTSFLVTGSQLIYNGETLSGGDVLFGDNTAGKANMHWNSMAGQLEFRGGTTVNAYVDVDGSIKAAGGALTLNATGLTIQSGIGSHHNIAWVEAGSGNTLLYINSQQSSSYSDAYFMVSADPSGFMANASMVLRASAQDARNANINMIAINGTSTSISLDADFVGINTLSPSKNLDVNGTMGVSGTATHSGDLVANGKFPVRIILFTGCGNATVPNGATYSAGPGSGTISATITNNLLSSFPGTLIVDRAYVQTATSQPSSGSLVISVALAGVTSSISITVPAGSASGNYYDISHTGGWASGTGFYWILQNNATAASCQIRSISTSAYSTSM